MKILAVPATLVISLVHGGSAQAQSSVSVFGVMDANVVYTKGSLSHKTALASNGARLGFRGSEDLGGGMSASFWLEAGFTVDDGLGMASSTDNQVSSSTAPGGLTFNRRSTVSLSGPWGEARLGRDASTLYNSLVKFDPFAFSGIGTSRLVANLGFSRPTMLRVSNAMSYVLPSRAAPLFGQLQIGLGENPSSSPAPNAGRFTGLRTGYAQGPVSAALTVNRTLSTAAPAASGAPARAGDYTVWNLGGTWDFSTVQLYAQAGRETILDANNVAGSGADHHSRGWMLGAVIPVTSGRIRASYAGASFERDGVGSTGKARQTAVSYWHDLSKRSAWYVTYARISNADGAALSLNGGTTTPNSSSSGMEWGVRHLF
jgi:predicted porin